MKRETRQRALFRRDFKRKLGGIYGSLLQKGGELEQIVTLLEENIPLPAKYRDHPLHGDREGSRECHIRPDFLLIYKYEGEDLLMLERLGSHSELFGM